MMSGIRGHLKRFSMPPLPLRWDAYCDEYKSIAVAPYAYLAGRAHAHEQAAYLASRVAPPRHGLPCRGASLQSPPLVILLRGAPGAGKTTWAARYKAKYPGETIVLSATDYFRGWDGVVR